MKQLNPNSSKPLHAQAEEVLRQMINQEEYVSGKLLPNEVDISKQLNISRNTLRLAINKLVLEGLLIRKKGYGTKVAKREMLSVATNWMSFSQEMKALGVDIYNFELHLSRVKADEKIRNFFNIAKSDTVFVLERVRGKKNQPIVYFISYFNPKINITGNENFGQPLYDIIEKEKKIILKTSREEISSMLANEDLAHKLQLNVGDPVLVRKRFVFDVNEMPVEYNIGYYRADSFTYCIECIR